MWRVLPFEVFEAEVLNNLQHYREEARLDIERELADWKERYRLHMDKATESHVKVTTQLNEDLKVHGEILITSALNKGKKRTNILLFTGTTNHHIIFERRPAVS